MAQVKIVHSTAEFIDAIHSHPYRVGLGGEPVTPWYLGQPDPGNGLVPGFYKAGIDPEIEREILRDFRIHAAEFVPPKNVTDTEWMIAAHANGVPTRILEWQSNALAALFLAVESMAKDKHGKVWILNPWSLNESTGKLSYVPMTDTEYFTKYVVKLTDPEAAKTPEAVQPMAFRPYHTVRPYNTQGTYFTVHGSSPLPMEELKFFLKKSSSFLAHVLIDGDRKKAIMKELYGLGVTRSNLFPGAPAVGKTIAYRYSKDYLQT